MKITIQLLHTIAIIAQSIIIIMLIFGLEKYFIAKLSIMGLMVLVTILIFFASDIAEEGWLN